MILKTVSWIFNYTSKHTLMSWT